MSSNNLFSGWTFEKFKIHDGMYILRESTKHIIIGYTNKHPDGFWYWFIMNDISFIKKGNDGKFTNIDDCFEDLGQTFITFKMNKAANKIGILDNKDLVKGVGNLK